MSTDYSLDFEGDFFAMLMLPGDLVEKTESPKGERAVKPVISFPSEKWVLRIGFFKGTKLVTNT